MEREDGKEGEEGEQEGGDGGEESLGGLVARWRLNCSTVANLQCGAKQGRYPRAPCLARS